MKDTGGSAFPAVWNFGTGESGINEGMTLRDYFAAKALHVANFQTNEEFYKGNDDMEGFYQEVAEKSYLYADAMIAERNKP